MINFTLGLIHKQRLNTNLVLNCTINLVKDF